MEGSGLLARVTRDFLEGDGYQVLMASNPREAIGIAENHHAPIHLLLTDVVMPDMNGRELAERLLAKRPVMKVLYMSGYPNRILSEHAFRAEDSAFIEKPFSYDALSRKVRHTLNHGPHLEANLFWQACRYKATKLSRAALFLRTSVEPFSSIVRCLLNSLRVRVTVSRDAPISCAISS